MRRLDGIVDVHGEVEGPARLCRAGKEQHHRRCKTPRHLGHAVPPDRLVVAQELGIDVIDCLGRERRGRSLCELMCGSR